MIVADTSTLISISSVNLLDIFITEFNVHTTETVVEELEKTSGYDDRHGQAAQKVLDNLNRINTHQVERDLTSSRIDQGEGSCALLTKETEAEFLVTDDLRALPELQNIADAKTAISPIILQALVKKDELEQEEAIGKLEELAKKRDWLGTPIYQRAKNLLE